MTGRERLAELLDRLAIGERFTPSLVDGVEFLRSSRPVPREPVVYDPGIVIVAQGRKRGYLGGRVFTYDAHNYLVLSVPLPFECETVEASPQKPLLGVVVRVTPSSIAELLVEMDEDLPLENQVPQGIYATPLTDKLNGTAVRLLECLQSPVDSRILGPQIVREITYLVLRGEQGGALRALASRHSQFGQVARVLRRIHTEFACSFDIESLAREAHMGVSTFHHNFKAVTSTSPMQYLKSIRLHRARMLMAMEGHNAGTAANMVGYESASQFSREFKRFFGRTPGEEAVRMRARTTEPMQPSL